MKENKPGTIIKVSGPLVVASGMNDVRMFDVVKVSDKHLIGEVIEIRGDKAWIQVYEETAGIGPGEPVYGTGEPLSVELGPGLIESIYDGIQRPLDEIMKQMGAFIARGAEIPGLNRTKKWTFEPVKKVGDEVVEGDIIGEVQETELIRHKIMVPPGKKGKITEIKAGTFTVEETVAHLDDAGTKIALCMMQKWPVRTPRPFTEKLTPQYTMVTGQRVIDSFFPVNKGGTACVPGPFGSGKTVIQHQLAKWADAQVVVYVGCGERGNEMTDVLREFPELIDPRSDQPLMKRTLLIANTSNMPVAAREASVYTGITLGEYFRDMGYSVALMADSTSRWAEAMREISGRLEEMPGEEGYPAYLGRRVAEFYERAGRVHCMGSEKREGNLTVIGAVSPPGGDLSDPVVQTTLRVVKVFWSLEDKLAFKRHFPAISWLNSYSLYNQRDDQFLPQGVEEDWPDIKTHAMRILQDEASLEEIVRLVGVDALSSSDRLILEVAKCLREDFLHQNAFDEIDTFTSMNKQYLMLKTILSFNNLLTEAIEAHVDFEDILPLKTWEAIATIREIPEDKLDKIDEINKQMKKEVAALLEKEKNTVSNASV